MNVLFILSEHHNPFFLGCGGNPITDTPNLNRLAEGGTRFEHTYCTSPHCVPARAGLISGRHGFEIGSYCNATPWNPDVGGWPFFFRDHNIPITTVGKLDFMPHRDHGFAEERLPKHRDSLDIHSLYRQDEIMPRFPELAHQIRHVGPLEETFAQRKDALILDDAIDWLRHDRPADRSWVLNVNFFLAHPIWSAPPDLWDKYDQQVRFDDLSPKYHQSLEDLHPYCRSSARHLCADFISPEDIRRAHVGFHANCELLDRNIGRLIHALEDLHLLDDTMIVYSADHGASIHAHRCWTLLNLWEDAIRVPLIIRHPDGHPGHIDANPTHHHDVFPTIADALGLEPPPDFRGHSLMPAVTNADTSVRDDYTLAELHNNGCPASCFAVSNGHTKYVECVGQRPMLFDLDNDPDEMNDLAVTAPDDPATTDAIANARTWLCNRCSPRVVDARVKADQRRLRDDLARTGQLQAELVKRGYLPTTDRLVYHPDTLAAVGLDENWRDHLKP